MRRFLWLIVSVGSSAAASLAAAAPVAEGYADDLNTRIHWQAYEATDIDNPRPLANEFTYLYWFEAIGGGTSIHKFDFNTNPGFVGEIAGPLTATGIIPETGPAPGVVGPDYWKWHPLFDPSQVLS